MRETELDRAYAMMGARNEKTYLPIITKKYGICYKTASKWDQKDFLGESWCAELKSRDMSVFEKPDTMIGYNKVVEGFRQINWLDHLNYRVYFLFAFEEGLYEWELTKENYEKNGGDSMIRFAGTKNRGWNDYKKHYHIKREYLVKIDDTPVYVDPLVKANSNKKLPRGVCYIKLNDDNV